MLYLEDIRYLKLLIHPILQGWVCQMTKNTWIHIMEKGVDKLIAIKTNGIVF